MGRITGGISFLEGVGFVSREEGHQQQLLGGGGGGGSAGDRLDIAADSFGSGSPRYFLSMMHQPEQYPDRRVFSRMRVELREQNRRGGGDNCPTIVRRETPPPVVYRR